MELEFKGTKGEWGAVMTLEPQIIEAETGRLLCTVNTDSDSLSELFENAKLIASAPDLLEALQNLVEDTEHCELDYNQRKAVKKAKIAIEKALK